MENLKFYLEKARDEKFAVGQFNFSDFTQVKGITSACKKLNAPIILGTSEGESKFFGLEETVAIRDVLRKKLGVPIFLNLDHGKSFEYLKQAIDAGYDMVHFDGSKLPLDENIKITKEVVAYAKEKGVLVEGEIGRMGTDSSKLYEEKFEINEQDLSDPKECKRYLAETEVDLLAVCIGTFHGIEASGINPNLRIDVLELIKKETDNTPLVMHGGSATPEDDVKEAISKGICKININTELRLAFSGNLRRELNKDTNEIVPYKFLQKALDAVATVALLKIKLFGSEGKV
jgi:fructose-bisphosphate aldolase, class II